MPVPTDGLDQKSQLICLSGLILDHDPAFVRQLPRQMAHLAVQPDILKQYDQTTLTYIAIGFLETKKIRLYCPRLFNFGAVIKDGKFLIDSKTMKQTRARKFARFEYIDFRSEADIHDQRILLDYQGAIKTLPLHVSDSDRFAGRNVLYTMQRDNDLVWIKDWVKFHVKVHQADAVVIADNNSTRYTPQQLMDAIGSLAGIQKVTVVTVPFKYGPTGNHPKLGRGRFLQMALQNAIRDFLLRKARAVLSIDIDELVISRSGRSIFDAVVASPFGATTIPGFWRICDPDIGAPTHLTSVYIAEQGKDQSAPKYAVVPDSFLGGTPWATHSLVYLPRKLLLSKEFWFAHCRDVTTNWTGHRDHHALPPTAVRDKGLEKTLKQVFTA